MDNFETVATKTLDCLDQCFMAMDHGILDFDREERVFIIESDDLGKYIVSLQGATDEIWVAAATEGKHFAYNDERSAWCMDGDGEGLFAYLGRRLSEALGEDLNKFFKDEY